MTAESLRKFHIRLVSSSLHVSTSDDASGAVNASIGSVVEDRKLALEVLATSDFHQDTLQGGTVLYTTVHAQGLSLVAEVSNVAVNASASFSNIVAASLSAEKTRASYSVVQSQIPKEVADVVLIDLPTKDVLSFENMGKLSEALSVKWPSVLESAAAMKFGDVQLRPPRMAPTARRIDAARRVSDVVRDIAAGKSLDDIRGKIAAGGYGHHGPDALLAEAVYREFDGDGVAERARNWLHLHS